MKNQTLTELEEMNDCLDSMYWRQHRISGELRSNVKVLEDALREILDQVSEHTGPMPTMVREIAKQALGKGETEDD